MMALSLALLALPAAWAQTSIEDFLLGGSASVVSEDCIRLTPDHPYVSGSAWFQNAIDLKQPFEMRLSLVLGTKDLEGADGIVFVFHPRMRTGFRGEGMGFAGLIPSLGIEFDTYRNDHLNDPMQDHLALMTDGRSYHGDGGSLIELSNLEDGERHPLRITWSPDGQLNIYLDGSLKASYGADALRATFGEQSIVYWGMTAATGRLSNAQDVCIEKLFLGV